MGTHPDGATNALPGNGRRIHVIPTRFVVACTRGHLDEFPWSDWLLMIPENKKLCQGDRSCSLSLKSNKGTGLSSLYLICTNKTCGATRSMGDVFSKGALRGNKCKGHMPWLRENKEEC